MSSSGNCNVLDPLPALSAAPFWEQVAEGGRGCRPVPCRFSSIYYVNSNFSPTQRGGLWPSISLEQEFTPYCRNSLKMQSGLPDCPHISVCHVKAKNNSLLSQLLNCCGAVSDCIHLSRWMAGCAAQWLSHVLFLYFLAWSPPFSPEPSLVASLGMCRWE